MKLEDAAKVVHAKMNEISKIFLPHMKFTLVVRDPMNPEGELVFTNDPQIPDVIKTLERSFKREKLRFQNDSRDDRTKHDGAHSGERAADKKDSAN